MSDTPRSTPFTLTADVAGSAAAFAHLLTAAYPTAAGPGNRRTLSDAELATHLAASVIEDVGLADWVLLRLADGERLSPYQYGMLDAVDSILGKVFALPAFHPQLAAALRPHRGALAAQALTADGWVTNPRHPARRLLAALYTLACGWHPDHGGGARAQADLWLSQLAHGEQRCEDIAGAAAQWLDEERRRVERVEKRLLDAESGALRTRRARQVAARTLNQALANRAIDIAAAAAIREDWFAGMQWVLLSEGEQSPLWQRVKRATGSLRWTLSPDQTESGNSQFHRVIAQVKDELEAIAAQVFRDALPRDRLLEAIDSEHLRILRNHPRDTAPFTPVDADDAVGDGTAEISDNLVDAVRALEPGQWLQLREENTVRRARLLLKQDESRQVLLVNALGLKVLSCSWETLALRLANRDALPLLPTLPLAACIAAVVTQLEERQKREQENRLDAIRSARAAATAEVRSREAARQKALAEAQQLETARRDTQRQADAVAARDAQAGDDAMQQRRQRARLLASSLTIGTWLAFRDYEGGIIRRRLTVLLPSTGKYIFVDANGGEKIELMRDELVRALAEERIGTLSKDQRLDDALTRVVGNLQQDRGKGDRE